ncbi:MAG TPA: sugar ABC transporter permease [Bauldia sp.]|nr:sugar ABC transporter permease [Bauldia sp.]
MQRAQGFLFILPAIIVLALLVLYPIAYTGLLSVTDETGNYVGLANYTAVVGARMTATAVRNTVYYVAVSIVFQVVLGTAAGILLNQRFRGRALVRAVALLPWVVPGIVAATTWAWMFHTEFGIINYALTSTGIVSSPVGWLTDRDIVMPALIAINVWKLFPFVAVMVLAALQAVPNELYESARIDGANFWHEVRHVMLPQIRPVLVAITLLLIIWGLNAITIIYTITRGGPANRTLITPIQIFRYAFESFDFNGAAALSVMFFLVALVFVAIYIKLFATERDGRLT